MNLLCQASQGSCWAIKIQNMDPEREGAGRERKGQEDRLGLLLAGLFQGMGDTFLPLCP